MIEDSLGYLVNRVARSIAHQLAEEIRPAGVAIGQWAVLMFLWARDGMSQADLSRLVAIEPPTMVRTIDRMVRDGLVIRIADPSDGRVSRSISPTAVCRCVMSSSRRLWRSMPPRWGPCRPVSAGRCDDCSSNFSRRLATRRPRIA